MPQKSHLAGNKLTEEEWVYRLNLLYNEIEYKTQTTSNNVRELFRLYNDRFIPQEFGIHCGSCVSRVNKFLKKYWQDNHKIKPMPESNNDQTQETTTTDPNQPS